MQDYTTVLLLGLGLMTPAMAAHKRGSASCNPLRIAQLRWFGANQGFPDLPSGANAYHLAFDGTHVWVTNADATNLVKLRASDGSRVGAYALPAEPRGMAFDGTCLWVASWMDNSVTKVKLDGTPVGKYPVGNHPCSVAFDGENIWVTNYGSNTVSKLRGEDGSLIAHYATGSKWGDYAVGCAPAGLAFDGEAIWVSNHYSNSLTKLDAEDGSCQGTYGVGNKPVGLGFDGVKV